MKNQKLEHLGLLLLPSMLGLTLSIVLAVFAIGATFIANSASADVNLSGGLQLLSSFSSENLDTLKQTLARNEIIGSLPLTLFWAAVGLVVYTSATHLYAIFANAEQLREQMEFVHASRREMLIDALEKVMLRIVAIIAWFGLIKLSIEALVPYVGSSLQIAAGSMQLVDKIGYSALAAMTLVFSIHLHVMLIRLITLRYRLFG